MSGVRTRWVISFRGDVDLVMDFRLSFWVEDDGERGWERCRKRRKKKEKKKQKGKKLKMKEER